MISLIDIVQEYLNDMVSKKKHLQDLKEILSLPVGKMDNLLNLEMSTHNFAQYVQSEYLFELNANDIKSLKKEIYFGWSSIEDYKLIHLYICRNNFSYAVPYYLDIK